MNRKNRGSRAEQIRSRHAVRLGGKSALGGTPDRRGAVVAAFAVSAALMVGTGAILVEPAGAATTGGPTGFTPRAGVAQDPVMIFHEDFQNIDTSGPAVPLVDYASLGGIRYTAEGEWVDTIGSCNGFVASVENDMTGMCNDNVDSQGGLRELADVLGQVNGTNPNENAVVAAYTSGTPYASGLIEFATDGETIPLPTPNRFATFSVNAAATSCWAAQPQLRFSLMSGGVETPISGADAINPCTDSRAQAYVPTRTPGADPVFYAGAFTSGGSFLTTGSPVGVVMRNDSGATAGNDAAFDDIQLLDVTPHLNKEFLPERVPVGGSSTLTLTVTNTSELASKEGWAFTDTLRSGLRFADDPNLGGTCNANVALNSAAGSHAIEVTAGELANGEESCTITVDVTSDTPRGDEPSPTVYVNNIEDISNVVGLDATNETTVEFYSEPKLVVEKTSSATEDTRAGETVTFSVTATNIGSGDFTNQNPAIVFDDLADVLDDASYNNDAISDRTGTVSYVDSLLSWEGALPVGESVTLSYSTVLNANGNGKVRNVAWQPNDPSTPQAPSCEAPENGLDPATGEPCAAVESLLPRLTVEKTADKTGLLKVGDKVTYSITVTNVGPGTYTEDAPALLTDNLSRVLDDIEAPLASDFKATKGSVRYAAPQMSWTGALANGESVDIEYTVTYSGKGDQILYNQACIPEQEVAPGAKPCDDVQIPGEVPAKHEPSGSLATTGSEGPVAAVAASLLLATGALVMLVVSARSRRTAHVADTSSL